MADYDCADSSALTGVKVYCWNEGVSVAADDLVAEEVPIALIYNGISHAVMMATPLNLDDFGLGFSLTEGVISRPQELYDLEIEVHEQGIELRMEISTQRFASLKQQRRNLVGRTGCGLCGLESLQQVLKPVEPLENTVHTADEAIQKALSQLGQWQPLRRATGASHGAAWCSHAGDILSAREDVGRHNALDKLIGWSTDHEINIKDGFILISSRASFEMVQKVVSIGAGTLVAVSAPTSLALDIARKTGLQLVGFGRPGRHTRYT